MLSPVDLDWMLRELPDMPAPARDTIARCVSPLARHPGAAEADLILGMDAAHPAYPYTGWLREPLSTDSEPARRSRREQQENADEARRRTARRQERSAGLMAALDDAGRDPAACTFCGIS